MKKMILLFSHRLTRRQIEDAREKLGVEKFVYLPQNLQMIWSGLDPKQESIKKQLEPVLEYIKKNAGKANIFLVQGDFGAVFLTVNLIKSLGMKAYYSTTKRIYDTIHVEEDVLKNTHMFAHEIFREFEYP